MSAAQAPADCVEKPHRRSPRYEIRNEIGSVTTVVAATASDGEKPRSEPPRADRPARDGREHAQRGEAESEVETHRDVPRTVVTTRAFDLLRGEKPI